MSVLPGACSVPLVTGSSSLCLATPSKAYYENRENGALGRNVCFHLMLQKSQEAAGRTELSVPIHASCSYELCYAMLCYVMLCYVMSMLSYWIPTMNPCSWGWCPAGGKVTQSDGIRYGLSIASPGANMETAQAAPAAPG